MVEWDGRLRIKNYELRIGKMKGKKKKEKRWGVLEEKNRKKVFI